MSKSISPARRRAGLGILFVLLAVAGIAEPLWAQAPFSWGWIFLIPALAAATMLVIRHLIELGHDKFIAPILFGGFFGLRSFADSVWTSGQSWHTGVPVALFVATMSAALSYAAGNVEVAVEAIRKNRTPRR